MEIIKNKKAMYFTLMTVAFLLIFLFVFMIPSYKRLTQKTMAVEMRVDSMNDFIKDLERDTERGLYISSYRALLALQQYIIINGNFLDDTETRFIEAIMNGTVNSKNSSFMSASTFPLWVEKMKEEALKFNLDADITINNMDIYQNDPWHISIGANLTFFIRDATEIASWNREQYMETSVSIIGFEDPLYIVNSFGRKTNTINITPFEGNYTYKIDDEWNVDNLLLHLENSYYTFNQQAPSFLMRFENNLSNSPYGIESLVNLRKLNEQGLDINSGSSVVDYYYWAGIGNGEYRVELTPGWFRLDEFHLEKYQVTQLAYQEE